MEGDWARLGEVLVGHSARVKAGERVMIAMAEVDAFPLAKAVYESVVKAGGLPQVQFLSESMRRSMLKYGSAEQLAWVPEMEAKGMEWADVYFGLRGAANLGELWDIDAERLAINQRAVGKVSTLRWEKTRWCLVRVPNALFAQQAGMDEGSMGEMFFASCLLDWEAEGARWGRWADRLARGREIRVVGEGTDLRFSTEGRRWVVYDGRTNMPDGEIATAPVESSVDGVISFEEPGVLSGRLMEGIRLRWGKGRLVEAYSETNQDFLKSIVETDSGSSLLGEFAFGVNPEVKRFCKDILIDEKIGGTVHIALGRAYPECGGRNQSAIHWDIVKDLRRNGTVYLDGEPVLRNGEYF